MGSSQIFALQGSIGLEEEIELSSPVLILPMKREEIAVQEIIRPEITD